MPSPGVNSVPGKTFLVGEYLALEGGPSLILTTEPRFSLRVSKMRRASAQRPHTFAGASPAGRFYVRHEAKMQGWGFRFDDPHRGAGGLGASSAQFALMHAWLSGGRTEQIEKYDWQQLLTEYRACAWNGEGVPPSGADVVAQMVGGVCFFDGREFRAERLSWDFPDLAFTLVRTGVKLATHEHLRRTKAVPHDELRECVASAEQAFKKRSETMLVDAIRECGEVLRNAGLTAEATLGLISAIREQVPGVRAVKGCGAMGADVILVVHGVSESQAIRAWAHNKGLEVCGDHLALAAQGLKAE